MERFYDVIVVGGGPAGLTAALYLARARYRVLVVEKEQFGGQITITAEVVNYPGVERASGKELTETMRRQAESFGAEFLLAEVEGLKLGGDIKTIQTSRGEWKCFGVLLATGAHPRMVGFRGEEAFRGHGVAYCATCDGEFFTGKEVFVVGGGFAAAEESVFLTKYASHVTVLIRGADFSCASATAEAARKHEKITVLTHTQVEEVAGDTVLRYLRYRNTATGEVTEYRAKENDTFGVFVFAGYEPATALVKGIAELDEQGYLLTDRNQRTSVEGLYAAGDVCVKGLRQVVTAVGEGALAATELERYAAGMQEKTGLHPAKPIQKEPVRKAGQGKATEVSASQESKSRLFSQEILASLEQVFEKMEETLCLKLCLNDSQLSAELEHYITELGKLTDKLKVQTERNAPKEEELPCVRVYKMDGTFTGLAFHGVPGGHEFTSFILGLYHAAGSGQALDQGLKEEIQSLGEFHMKVLVSLSCTMCPELVTAAQRIAAEHASITAEVYDLNHFEGLRTAYQVMSVPCLVVNDTHVTFGKKNIRQLLDYLESLG